jgi:hypothetical protein
MRKSLPLLVLLGTAAFVPAACSSKPPAAPSLTVDAGFAFGGQDGGAPEAGPVAPVASAPPSASASAAPSASASVAPALLAAGADAALDAAIQTIASKDAPGMTAEGSVGHETLQEGGHFNMIVTLQPGKCYTIIAMSAPLQVSELGVQLFMLPLNLASGQSPASDKNPAVLGRGKAGATCPISPIPVPYKVDVTAKKGAGRIAVAVFSRSK